MFRLASRARSTSEILAGLAGLAAVVVLTFLLASGRAAAQGADGDLDGVADAEDNCPRLYNPDQEDHDGDGVGTTCDATRGVPGDESTVVLYLRDQNGRPVRDACFTVTVQSAPSEAEPPGPLDVCGDQTHPGFALVRLDPAVDARAEFVQAEPPPSCTGGLAAGHVHTTAPGNWETLTVRYRCGEVARDEDRDFISDDSDNCPNAFNPDQEDADEDVIGNTCDPEPGTIEDESHVVFYLRDQDGRALWDVCFELTQVRTDETLEPADLCVEDSTPGYFVISLDAPGGLRSEVAQTGSIPGCRGGLRGRQSYEFTAASWRVVDLRYVCGTPVTFSDRLTTAGRSEEHSIRVVKATTRIEFVLRWRNRRDSFDVTGITFGDAARRLTGTDQRPNRLTFTRRRTATSILVRVRKQRPGKFRPGAPSVAEHLAFRVVGKKVRGAATVVTRVRQYPR